MKKIVCPKCGNVDRYERIEKEKCTKTYNAKGYEILSSYPMTIYAGANRCALCGRIVRIIDVEEPKSKLVSTANNTFE